MFDTTDKTEQWFLARWGRFTASESYKLMIPGQQSTFGDGANTYIESRALEMCTHMVEKPELEEVKSLLWGKMYEYPAFQAYIQETKHYSMTYMGSENPVFLEYEPMGEESGGTPDVVNINDGAVDHGCEIKCPKNPAYHFRRLSWKSQWNLKENYPLCYSQIQMLLMITGAATWDFASFDERQIMKSKQLKVVEVKPDIKFQNNLEARIGMAIKKKYEILSDHMGHEIKSKSEFKTLIKQKQNGIQYTTTG